HARGAAWARPAAGSSGWREPRNMADVIVMTWTARNKRAPQPAARGARPARTTTGMQWIFAYGSLLWRPDFPYNQRRRAAVRGWRRRFWQASPDHRGRPEAPGRVVTLIAEADALCHGLAFAP